MAQQRRRPGDDRPVAQGADLTVLTAIRECKREAEAASRRRRDKNRLNLQAFLGEQDWTHKQKGQSKEFLPKSAMVVEQLAAFVKRALVDFGEWFDIKLPPGSPIPDEAAKRYLRCKLDHLSRVEEDRLDFATLTADAVKAGLLESVITLKVHGRDFTKRQFVAERGVEFVNVNFNGQTFREPQRTSRLTEREVTAWQLLIDLVPQNDFYPDPRGRGLYRIHHVERDLADVLAWAEAGIYDMAAVEQIEQDFADLEEEFERTRKINQDVATPPCFRKRVVIDEFWGTLLNSRGRVAQENILAAMANDRYLIRPPESNPNWHGQSAFVSAPLLRVPFSTHHKAVMDHVTALNLALNELFNLMLDGGLSRVWGIKQLKLGALEDPAQVSDGISQGMTLLLKDEFPAGAKALERVDAGEVPPEALQMFVTVDREIQSASFVNDIKLGMLPPRQVKATEVVEASQNASVFIDGVVRDLEDKLIEPTLWKAWVTLMQHADDLDADEVVQELGPITALKLARMSPAERFALLGYGCKVKVFGLSAVLARARDFAKMVGLMQMVVSNPLLLPAFLKRYSPDKTLATLMRKLNINPEDFELTEQERQAQTPDQRLQELMAFSQIVGGPGGQARRGTPPAEESGGASDVPAEINQTVNPLTGMTANQ